MIRHTKPLLRIAFMSMLIYGNVMDINCQGAHSDTTYQSDQEEQVNTGKKEDVGRFMGQDPLLERYLSLPYDTVMNVNIPSAFMHIGYMLVIFLPFLLLFGRSSKSWTGIVLILLLGIGLAFSVSSSFRQRLKTDHATAFRYLKKEQTEEKDMGLLKSLSRDITAPFLHFTDSLQPFLSKYSGNRDKITYPLLFGGFLLLLFFTLRRFRSQDILTQSIMLVWLYYGFLWLLLSGGIAWYGILIYPLGLLLVTLGMTRKAKDDVQLQRLTKPALLSTSAVWLLLFFPLRFTGLSPEPDIRGKLPHYPEIVNFQIGKINSYEAIEKLYPQAQEAAAIMNANPESLIYGVGTFMPFFVEKSDKRIFPDPYLDFFMRLMDEIPDNNSLAGALHAYGFDYIILDLKLPSIDQTKDQTLTQKFQRFLSFLDRNQHIQVLATDHLIKMDSDGREIFTIGSLEPHSTIRGGRFVVYRLR